MPTPHAPNTRKTVLTLLSIIVFMGALAWASVPLYDLFCRVTGFGGTTQKAGADAQSSAYVLDQTMVIRFDASKARNMPWEFKAVEHERVVRIGETAIAFYEAYNPTNETIAGTASYNVAPFSAGGFFVKVDCFCFTEQILAPGERVKMPVVFYVDPEIVTDRDAKYTEHITLSYTFHRSELPEDTKNAPSTTNTTKTSKASQTRPQAAHFTPTQLTTTPLTPAQRFSSRPHPFWPYALSKHIRHSPPPFAANVKTSLLS